MRIIASSVTRIVLPCPLVNIRVSPYRKPTSATPCRGWSASPPNQLGHNVEGYPAWQGQSIQGEFLFDPQNPSQGPWRECWWRCSLPLWLSLSPIWLRYCQLILHCVMDNIYDDVVSRLERPDLGQDHEGSLHEPDKLHLDLQRGVNYVWPFGLEVIWEKVG